MKKYDYGVWNHNELAEDLAHHIGNMPFLDVYLGSPVLDSIRGKKYINGKSTQRADVVSVKPSYRKFCISVYEVKVSRADFLNDIRSEKWRGYLQHCERIYFAVPAGMVSKEEVPEEAGLFVRGEKGWKCVKAAKVRDVDIPTETLKALIFSKTRLSEQQRHANEVYSCLRYDKHTRYQDFKRAKKLFGKEITEALKKQFEYEHGLKDIEFRKKDIEAVENEIGEILKEIRLCLGLRGHSSIWTRDIEKKLEEIKQKAIS